MLEKDKRPIPCLPLNLKYPFELYAFLGLQKTLSFVLFFDCKRLATRTLYPGALCMHQMAQFENVHSANMLGTFLENTCSQIYIICGL